MLVGVGGVAFAAATLATALAPDVTVLLAAQVVASPASGAFVGLSQTTLMDLSPAERERNMARWTLAGSAGVLAAPLCLAALVQAGSGWRGLFGALSLLALAAVPVTIRVAPLTASSPDATVGAAVATVLRLARDRRVWRWLLLLELCNLMLDVLHGFLALYLVDVVGLTPAKAALAVVLWTGTGLVGDLVLVLLLRHLDGLTYLRASAAATAVAYPAFLLAPGVPAKVGLLALLGLLNAGWYAIPTARLYDELGDQSTAAMTLSTATGLVGNSFPLAIGLLAGAVGIGGALLVPLVAPLALLLWLPRAAATTGTARQSR